MPYFQYMEKMQHTELDSYVDQSKCLEYSLKNKTKLYKKSAYSYITVH